MKAKKKLTGWKYGFKVLTESRHSCLVKVRGIRKHYPVGRTVSMNPEYGPLMVFRSRRTAGRFLQIQNRRDGRPAMMIVPCRFTLTTKRPVYRFKSYLTEKKGEIGEVAWPWMWDIGVPSGTEFASKVFCTE